MTIITDSITYNVRQRGRKHRGVDRNFDTAALASLINGPAVQEKVKHGDMFGYFGHWPRMKFGLEVNEGGIDGETGKAIALPVALRTVELSADNDGNITHRAEFLDTEAGRLAEGLYQSKAGGFSSAIDTIPRTSPSVPRGFYGFDYVYEPNYTTNRGHKVVLDAIGADLGAILDGLFDQAATEQVEMTALFDSLHGQHITALEALDLITRERDWAIGRLAKLSRRSVEEVLDSAALEAVQVKRLAQPDFERYRNAELSPIQEPKQSTPAEVANVAAHYGVAL